jgi:hypothetical protein
MSPEVGTILGLTAQKIAGGFAEHGAAFGAGQVGLIGMMLTLSAKEYDRAADIRFNENKELRALFGELAPRVADGALKGEIALSAQGVEVSLRISDLNTANYALRRLLTRLQVDAEGGGRRADEARIWLVLRALAARRMVSLA